jgi:hypothetical protein
VSNGVPSAFFSYSRNDSEFALRLAEDLRARGASVWLDQLDIEPGQRWAQAIQAAMMKCPRVLVILSPSSVESPNVQDEVTFALEEKKVIIPILYRDCKILLQLRGLHYADFRTDYNRGLQTLMKALGPEPQAATPVAAVRSATIDAENCLEPTRREPEHSTEPGASVPSHPRFSRNRRRLALMAIAATSAISVVGISPYIAHLIALRNSEVVRSALAQAQLNPAVTARLGKPVKPGWKISGSMVDLLDHAGRAQLSIPVSGPKGEGSLSLLASRVADVWKLDTLRFKGTGGPELDALRTYAGIYGLRLGPALGSRRVAG